MTPTASETSVMEQLARHTAEARDLMSPVLGPDRTEQLIGKLQDLEAVTNVRELRSLLSG